ncbi:MAG: cyclic nucleotide-binding domain-containing protein [Deltaproteobacteria bacterium]|nr:cyclic nucleotide-binding domain-containing protein [Deltaproteobacteria bacterium]
MEKEISLFKEMKLFNNLSEEKIQKVLGICTKVSFPENTIIMQEGKTGDTMYMILEGDVEVVKTLVPEGMDLDEDEKIGNKVFTKLKAEDHPVFGEISLFEESRRTATVKTLSDCTFYEINKDDFLRLAEKDYELGYQIVLNIAKMVCSRLRKADEDVIKLSTVLSIVLKET